MCADGVDDYVQISLPPNLGKLCKSAHFFSCTKTHREQQEIQTWVSIFNCLYLTHKRAVQTMGEKKPCYV